jgi:hypothetical protein
MARKDLKGMVFGKLTVLEFVGQNARRAATWKCLCSCGNTKTVTGKNLVGGKTKHCGCTPRPTHHEDLTGRVFGWMTVLEYAGVNKHRITTWKCQCKCEAVKVVERSCLIKGHTKSCGCKKLEQIKDLHKSNKKYSGTSLENRVLVVYKGNSKRKGREFSLSEETFYTLIHAPCHYCGTKNSNSIKDAYSDETMSYNGIDRLDSKVGYVETGNCVPCCTTCNRMKLELGEEDFLEWVELVFNNTSTK